MKYSLSWVFTIAIVMWMLLPESFLLALQSEQDQPREGLERASGCRRPEYDAVNCLYLQLRLLGYTESYEAFRDRVTGDPRHMSLKSLADLGRRLGFLLIPVTMTFSELAKTKSPVILHLEDNGIGSGRFILFLGMDETRIDVIDGSYITFEQMLNDRFRRKWTGYALVAQPLIDWQMWLRRCAATLVIAGAAVWLLIGKWLVRG